MVLRPPVHRQQGRPHLDQAVQEGQCALLSTSWLSTGFGCGGRSVANGLMPGRDIANFNYRFHVLAVLFSCWFSASWGLQRKQGQLLE